MEFDSEGRIIVPGNVKRDLDKEKRGIVLTKIQVSARSPAVAQLRISLGNDVQNKKSFRYELKRFCEAYVRLNFHEVDKNIKSNENYIIVESKNSLRIYSFLTGMAGGLRERFSNYPVTIKGSWAKD